MSATEVLKILFNQQFNWKKVNEQPCVHTFYNSLYINLCLWNQKGVKTISIEVDDVKNGIDDLANFDVNENNQRFTNLLNIYNQAKKQAINVAFK